MNFYKKDQELLAEAYGQVGGMASEEAEENNNAARVALDEVLELVQSWTAKLNSNEKIDIHPQFYADGLSDDLRALKKQLVTEFINDLVSIREYLQ